MVVMSGSLTPVDVIGGAVRAAGIVELEPTLHPNAAGYRRMGERFHRLVFEEGPFRLPQ